MVVAVKIFIVIVMGAGVSKFNHGFSTVSVMIITPCGTARAGLNGDSEGLPE